MPATQNLDVDALLARLPLFSNLEPGAVSQIACATRQVEAGKGEVIVHKGAECTGLYVVLYGQVKLAFPSAGGGEKILEIIGQGQTFGEALMFIDKLYMLSAQALTDATLLHIPKSAIFDGLRHNPAFGRTMIAGISRRLHQMVSDVESYSLQSATQRVIGYLLREVPENETDTKVTVGLPVSKRTVASCLNLTQEHLSRVLNDLSSRDLIAVEGRKIHISDVARLRAYSA